MKKIILLATFCFSFIGLQAQEDSANSKWIFGVGMNIIDNTSRINNKFLNLNQMNVGNIVSHISLEYQPGNWGVILEANYNKLEANTLQNGIFLTRDGYMIGFDVNGKYYFDSLFTDSTKFDAALLGGLGANRFFGEYSGTANIGLSLQYWFKNSIGLRLQTVGKFAFNDENPLNNHIQHTVALIVRL
ncbi:MAG: hypothetical protein ACK4K1_08155 [Flavobacterium sp.]